MSVVRQLSYISLQMNSIPFFGSIHDVLPIFGPFELSAGQIVILSAGLYPLTTICFNSFLLNFLIEIRSHPRCYSWTQCDYSLFRPNIFLIELKYWSLHNCWAIWVRTTNHITSETSDTFSFANLNRMNQLPKSCGIDAVLTCDFSCWTFFVIICAFNNRVWQKNSLLKGYHHWIKKP